jgi:REP element-mobilizing transposase RayT
MARDLCIEFPDAFYHVCSRGINRQNLYKQEDDFYYFLALCRKAVEKFNIRIFAFCLMNNHYHLYLSTPEANISKVMKFLNQSYATHFLKTSPDKDGHVFKGRYKRKIVDSEVYSFTLLNYIHQNPVSAKIVRNPVDWRWSSYRSYVKPELRLDFIDYDWALKQFGSIKSFIEFHGDNQESSWNPEQDAKAGIFLGEEDFIVDICDRYINLNEIKSQNISGINELIQISNNYKQHKQMELCSLVDLLQIDQRSKDRVKAYLLNKYCSMSLTDIGKIIGKSANASRMVIKRLEQQFNENPDLFAPLIP